MPGPPLVAHRRLACSLVLLAALTASGCPPLVAAHSPQPNVLRVVRDNGLVRNAPPLRRTVRDAGAVRALYRAVLSLPAFPRGLSNCPIDFGVRYRLDFLRGSQPLLEATAAPGGCPQVLLSAGPRPLRQPTSAFWILLAHALGLSRRQLFLGP